LDLGMGIPYAGLPTGASAPHAVADGPCHPGRRARRVLPHPQRRPRAPPGPPRAPSSTERRPPAPAVLVIIRIATGPARHHTVAFLRRRGRLSPTFVACWPANASQRP